MSSDAMSIIRELATRDPYRPDSWGRAWCQYCGESPRSPHEPDCIVGRAMALVAAASAPQPKEQTP